ncbi:MAG: hypothetical protein ABIJ61_00700 [bacterium]
MATADCDSVSALELLSALLEFKDDLGYRLGYIADPKNPVSSREQVVEETISELFRDESATVQVSSKYRSAKSTRTIREYLNNLLRLNYTYGYISVHLEFAKSMGFVGIKSVGGDRYDVATSVWQLFTGTTDAGFSYDDATRKKIRQLVEHTNAGTWSIKATEITVSETIELEQWIRDERDPEFH